MSLRDKLLAVLRTAVAAGAGEVIAWAAAHWHVVLSPSSSAQVQGTAVVVATAGYLAGVSWLQRRWPGWSLRWSWLRHGAWLVALLLGSSHQPMYVPARAARPPRLAAGSVGGR